MPDTKTGAPEFIRSITWHSVLRKNTRIIIARKIKNRSFAAEYRCFFGEGKTGVEKRPK
jgi:hypothetical protein